MSKKQKIFYWGYYVFLYSIFLGLIIYALI